MKNYINLIWFIGCEVLNIIFASSLGNVRVILLFLVGIVPSIFSWLKEKEKTKQITVQVTTHEKEETQRIKIVEDANTERVKIQSSANSSDIKKITKAFLKNVNSLPPNELKKQNMNNIVYYNNFLKKLNDEASSKIKYKAETSPPVYNTSDKNETKDDNDENYKSFMQLISWIKDNNDEYKT